MKLGRDPSSPILGLIPARGGSRRLLHKNTRNFSGRPLIEWTIKAAQYANKIDFVAVSTEDSHIANISKDLSVDCVIDRPPSLAADDTPTTDVVLHALDFLGKKNLHFSALVLLQPTSPLRTNVHIDEACSIFESKKHSGLISVTRSKYPTEWMGQLPESLSMDAFIQNSKLSVPYNKLPPNYQINGAIYIANVKRFLKEETLFFPTGVIAYVMTRDCSIDIDDDYDFKSAEDVLHRLKRAES